VEGRGSLGGTCLNVGCIPSKALVSAVPGSDAPPAAAGGGRGGEAAVESGRRGPTAPPPPLSQLHSSHLYHDAAHKFKDYGISVSDVKVDLPQMMKQKESAVDGLTKGIEGLFKKNKVKYAKGWGKLVGNGQVEVAKEDGTTETLKAKNIIIATGSEVAAIPNVPIDEERIVSSTGALKLAEVSAPHPRPAGPAAPAHGMRARAPPTPPPRPPARRCPRG